MAATTPKSNTNWTIAFNSVNCVNVFCSWSRTVERIIKELTKASSTACAWTVGILGTWIIVKSRTISIWNFLQILIKRELMIYVLFKIDLKYFHDNKNQLNEKQILIKSFQRKWTLWKLRCEDHWLQFCHNFAKMYFIPTARKFFGKVMLHDSCNVNLRYKNMYLGNSKKLNLTNLTHRERKVNEFVEVAGRNPML